MAIGIVSPPGAGRPAGIPMDGKPVQFELMPDARASLLTWAERRGGTMADYEFPCRVDHTDHLARGAG